MELKSISSKKGAVELSVSTIVVLVIGMTMLILGIVLVRTIFTGATQSVDQINKGVQDQINKLFSNSDKRIVVNLPKQEVDIKKGQLFGIAFGIRNTDEGGSGEAQQFSYEIATDSVQTNCHLTPEQANSYIVIGGKGTATISPGDVPKALLVKIQPSESAPLCVVRYTINVKRQDQSFYDSEFFDVNIVGK